jgi:integrase/recombinase XerC
MKINPNHPDPRENGDRQPPPDHPPPGESDRRLMGIVLERLHPASVKAYLHSFKTFAQYCEIDSPAAALRNLFGLSHGQANDLVARYKAVLETGGASARTVALAVSALRAAARKAKNAGLTTLSIDVPPPRVKPYATANIPGPKVSRALLSQAEAELRDDPSPLHARDLAVVLLLHDSALRRSEIVALDYPDDFDPTRPDVRVTGRNGGARPAKRWLPVNERTRDALSGWVGYRGDWPGPLFTRTDRPGSTERLTGSGVRRVVERIGNAARLGGGLSPRDLRNAAIGHAIDAGWDARRVKAFARLATFDNHDIEAIERAMRGNEPGDDTHPAGPPDTKRRRRRSPKAETASKPVQAGPVGLWHELVILGGPDDNPIVLDLTKPRLRRKPHRVVKTLLDAGPNGLSERALIALSGCGGARGILKALCENDAEWRAVIRFPGKRGGGHYRIDFPGPGTA